MITNEGKACDAVIKRIENHYGHLRTQVRFPEKEGNPAPIELICKIGNCFFAFEHTRIAPFCDNIRLNVLTNDFFQAVNQEILDIIPTTEHIVLIIPIYSLLDLSNQELIRVQKTVATWIRRSLPTLPVSPEGRYTTPLNWVSIPGLTFKILPQRMDTNGELGQFRLYVKEPDDLESARIERIKIAFDKKLPKLAVWKKKKDTRTVLILEENDLQLTNTHLVTKAVLKVEKDIKNKPDEIYLVSTSLPSCWYFYYIRLNGKTYFDFKNPAARCWKVNPETLVDLTGR